MSSIRETATQFFDACETGKGWAACQAFCHPDATFSCEADTFAEVETLADYTDAMKHLIEGPVPDASYDLHSMAVDDDRKSVSGFAVFKGTHTGEGGPVPPSGKQVATDYVYVMDFDGDRIRHVTKIWNDVWAMRQIGWV